MVLNLVLEVWKTKLLLFCNRSNLEILWGVLLTVFAASFALCMPSVGGFERFTTKLSLLNLRRGMVQ